MSDKITVPIDASVEAPLGRRDQGPYGPIPRPTAPPRSLPFTITTLARGAAAIALNFSRISICCQSRSSANASTIPTWISAKRRSRFKGQESEPYNTKAGVSNRPDPICSTVPRTPAWGAKFFQSAEIRELTSHSGRSCQAREWAGRMASK